MKISKSIRHPLRRFGFRIRQWTLARKCRGLVKQIREILSSINEIPVFVISYNNGVYVQNITGQLNRYGITPIVIDNNSTSEDTHSILNTLENEGKIRLARSDYNFGHEVGFLQPVYDILPEIFCYTDPDIALNKNLPHNFIDILLDLTKEFKVYKAGFALSLEGHGPLKDIKVHSRHTKPFLYDRQLSIEEFEARYWVNRLKHDNYELYAAPIDTTFAAYRKSNYFGDFHNAIRVAGDFSAIHLPWFKEQDVMDETQKKEYSRKNRSTNWA
jgi:hypothetical protein